MPLALMAVGAASRVPMVLAMVLQPNARDDGLSAGVGTPPALSASVALVSGLLACLIGIGFQGALVLGWALLASVPLFILAKRKIGGQTGDVLGASQQCAEVAALAAAVAALT
jgi:adenosylcobinamide-GDP ribazoletransferase